MPVSCDLCGTAYDGEVPPLDWSLTLDRGRTRRYCDRCTRDHVRAMEGKLDQEFW